jgi:hypothetical protein
MRKLLTFLIALTIALSPIGSAFADGSGIYNPGSNSIGDFQGIDSNAASSVAPSLPLDGIATGIKAAYSTRRLLTSYAGKSINVKRASDSTTQDIGFVSNVLDTASLATFCSGTTGSVNIWYDQSGGGNNMTPGAAAGPIIYQSGAVTTINGKPAPLFVAASSTQLGNASLSSNPVNTLYQNAVVQPNNFAGDMAISGPSAVNGLEFRIDNTAGTITVNQGFISAIATSSGALTAATGAVAEIQYNSTTGAYGVWINRTSAGSGTAAAVTFAATTLELGIMLPAVDKYDGLMGEYIAYDLVGGIPGASQTSITNNQHTYWGTP